MFPPIIEELMLALIPNVTLYQLLVQDPGYVDAYPMYPTYPPPLLFKLVLKLVCYTLKLIYDILYFPQMYAPDIMYAKSPVYYEPTVVPLNTDDDMLMSNDQLIRLFDFNAAKIPAQLLPII